MQNHQINTMLYVENGAQTIGMAFDSAQNAQTYTCLTEAVSELSIDAAKLLAGDE